VRGRQGQIAASAATVDRGPGRAREEETDIQRRQDGSRVREAVSVVNDATVYGERAPKRHVVEDCPALAAGTTTAGDGERRR
jgi:hypothetical protein